MITDRTEGAGCPQCNLPWVTVQGLPVGCRVCGLTPAGAETLSGDNKPMSERSKLLREAEEIITGDRNNQYGDPRQDFSRTAAMWSAYLGIQINPYDVAAMMALLKVSRIRWSPTKKDSWLDLAGYAACGWDTIAPTEEESFFSKAFEGKHIHPYPTEHVGF